MAGEVQETSASEARVPASMFEALFVRGLRAGPALRAALLEVGVDVAALAPSYPGRVWLAALEVARAQLHPGLPPAEGLRALGRSFTEGFLATTVGRVVGGALPMLGPARIVDRTGRYVQLGRPDILVQVEVVGLRERLLHVQDASPAPHFFAGLLEAGVTRAGGQLHVTLEAEAPGAYVLRVAW